MSKSNKGKPFVMVNGQRQYIDDIKVKKAAAAAATGRDKPGAAQATPSQNRQQGSGVKFFEINLLLVDPDAEQDQIRDLRQYFCQSKGYAEALANCFAWVHLQVQKAKANNSGWVVERLILHEWQINTPKPNGEIDTCKFQKKVINWAFDRGIIELHKNLSNKQVKRFEAAARNLNRYRPNRSYVRIEEFGNELLDDIEWVHLTYPIIEGEIVDEKEFILD